MVDNELKYRYIQIHQDIDQENLAKLGDIFHYSRDEKLVKEICRQVDGFERKVKERVAEMERQQIDENRENCIDNQNNFDYLCRNDFICVNN